MDSIIIARRFVVIMLFAAVFAFSFSAVVEHAGRSGAQSHFGASFTCVQTGAPYCTTVQ